MESSFPKHCNACGRRYETAEDFLRDTHDLPASRSCLKEAIEDDGTAIVEVFRNCICGSTLMDEFSNRRDESEKGRLRREKFDMLLKQLVQKGLDQEVARQELRNFMNGRSSPVLDEILRNKKT